LDQRQYDRGALSAAIGSDKEPCLAAERDAAQRALGGVVAQADPGVIEEAGEGRGPLEHVIHGLGNGVVARELGAFTRHPVKEILEQGVNSSAARGRPACILACSALGRQCSCSIGGVVVAARGQAAEFANPRRDVVTKRYKSAHDDLTICASAVEWATVRLAMLIILVLSSNGIWVSCW
jgi:hypothetical protein